MLRACLVCLGLATTASSAIADEPLQYRFRAGEELVYELIGKEDLSDGAEESDRRYETKARWSVYPIRQNDDSSWRLIVGTQVKKLRYDRSESIDGEPSEWGEEPHVRFENTFLSYCDLMPGGSYAENPTLNASYLFGLLPELLFKPLPLAGPGAAPSARTAPTSGTTYTLAWRSTEGGVAHLAGGLERVLSANYQSRHRLDIEFDVAAGRVLKIRETAVSDREDFPSHTRTSYGLVKVIPHTAEATAAYEAAAESYFHTRNAWWELKMQAVKSRSQQACQDLNDRMRALIVEDLETVESNALRVAYKSLLALHDRESLWDLKGAAEREALYLQPPVDWETVNLAGEPRRLADYRGKVVVLDFWYRGCSHCILALPKIKALHAKYGSREDVVILGVNNDRDLEDANHVVRQYAIPYESVRNVMSPSPEEGATTANQPGDAEQKERRISAEYQVPSWPTFILLNQAGRVEEIVNGNHPDLVDQFGEAIDRLLAEKPR